jgi:hypothetical protein
MISADGVLHVHNMNPGLVKQITYRVGLGFDPSPSLPILAVAGFITKTKDELALITINGL